MFSFMDGEDDNLRLDLAQDHPETFDADGDGTIDTIMKDTDGDGILDRGYSDTNQDGYVDTIFEDKNQDGVMDEIHMDMDGDHIFETDIDDPNELALSASQNENLNDSIGDQLGYELNESTYDDHTSGFNSEQGIWYPLAYDPASGDNGIIGDPSEAVEHWHMQTHSDTCAVVSQEFVLEELTGNNFDENELRDVAIENGWYTPGGGTSMEDVGNLLEYYGLNVDKHEDSSISEIEQTLSEGDKVIVGLNCEDIWIPGQSDLEHALNEIQGIPGNDANHAVEVIGVDRSDPGNPMIILNDPGHPGGEGSMIPLNEFETAWSDSNHFVVTASEN